ncbi:MAG: hypothetical protein ACRD43_03700 [Pyrinomonadaceae bacterium]
MKAKLFLMLCILTIAAVSAVAQTKTVTNFELEKYRQQRVQAEKDLNENYKELGFASPEERAKRLETWKQESSELSNRLEMERIARENAEAAAGQAAAQQRYYQPAQPDYQLYNDGLIYGYGNGYTNRFPRRVPRQSGYFAGGAFWPGPSQVRQPMLVQPQPPRTRPRH